MNTLPAIAASFARGNPFGSVTAYRSAPAALIVPVARVADVGAAAFPIDRFVTPDWSAGDEPLRATSRADSAEGAHAARCYAAADALSIIHIGSQAPVNLTV